MSSAPGTHPIAHRIKNGSERPHLGPDIPAYVHAETLGHESDKWSAKLLRKVCSIANVLKKLGVMNGDTVSIYLPMAWQSVAALLACSCFNSESLCDRILYCKSRVLVTSDGGHRGGKSIAGAALKECPRVEHAIVLKRTGSQLSWTEGWDKCSTGKPKGVIHTTGGYLLGAAMTVNYVFDVHTHDKFACTADIGWITSHTYIVYGPLVPGVSTSVRINTPVYPTPSRYWQIVQKHQIPQFYSAPSIVVGEPVNPEAWHWTNEHVGKKESGSATVPFFGIDPAILDPVTGKACGISSSNHFISKSHTVNKELEGINVEALPISIFRPYPGHFHTGDGAARDEHGYIWIKGRVDDVINVSGNRLSTTEIESALILHKGVAVSLAAVLLTIFTVIGGADELTEQVVFDVETTSGFAYNLRDEGSLLKEVVLQVDKAIGAFAAPKKVIIVPDLPKTRSGKIMRIMRKIVAGEGDQLGDPSTISEPGIVEVIKKNVARWDNHI
ncbi:hypothetical protein EDC04DRAFT_2601584 [Pisolithus marmoratus]|nr:hypothetical protein EDC04DRAFT_2601584 [Pisolithus marmoratus]